MFILVSVNPELEISGAGVPKITPQIDFANLFSEKMLSRIEFT